MINLLNRVIVQVDTPLDLASSHGAVYGKRRRLSCHRSFQTKSIEIHMVNPEKLTAKQQEKLKEREIVKRPRNHQLHLRSALQKSDRGRC